MNENTGAGENPAELVIATRGSELALAQANWVAARLEAFGARCRLLTLVARGDRELDKPLEAIGGKGLFTREIDDAVLDGRADLAVHSLKDLPAQDEPGLILAAVPERESDRDVLALNPELVPEQMIAQLQTGDPAAAADVFRWLAQAGQGGDDLTVGCGSPRRRAQFGLVYSGVRLEGVRGNIQTRLRKLRENGWAGLVLAEAALRRLGLDRDVTYVPLDFYPAPGQGALGVRTRAGEGGQTADLLARLECPSARVRADAERAFLRTFAGGCHLPAGLRTRYNAAVEDRLVLTAAYFPEDCAIPLQLELTGPGRAAAELGAAAARQLRDGTSALGNCSGNGA